MDPKDLRYRETHEWAHLDGDVCTVGITQFAVEQLTDIVYVELPAAEKAVSRGQGFGEIESVKAVSDLYAPVSGEVLEFNQAVVTDPNLIATDPYGKGWLIKIKVAAGTTLDHLMTLEQYKKQIASESH